MKFDHNLRVAAAQNQYVPPPQVFYTPPTLAPVSQPTAFSALPTTPFIQPSPPMHSQPASEPWHSPLMPTRLPYPPLPVPAFPVPDWKPSFPAALPIPDFEVKPQSPILLTPMQYPTIQPIVVPPLNLHEGLKPLPVHQSEVPDFTQTRPTSNQQPGASDFTQTDPRPAEQSGMPDFTNTMPSPQKEYKWVEDVPVREKERCMLSYKAMSYSDSLDPSLVEEWWDTTFEPFPTYDPFFEGGVDCWLQRRSITVKNGLTIRWEKQLVLERTREREIEDIIECYLGGECQICSAMQESRHTCKETDSLRVKRATRECAKYSTLLTKQARNKAERQKRREELEVPYFDLRRVFYGQPGGGAFVDITYKLVEK